MNCPFPAGAGHSEILGVFQDRLLRAADLFKPDLVLTSAGFDSRFGDPLGRFTLSDQDFADLTRVMLEIADKHAAGRLVSVLEGGYDLAGLASAATRRFTMIPRLFCVLRLAKNVHLRRHVLP
jgi:acetoin utilization deacetylase AcuC-like enzyme